MDFGNFIQTPMIDFFIEQEIKEVPLTLENALKNDLTKIFLKDLEFRCKKVNDGEKRPQRNIILDIYGQTGSGKSEIGLYILDYVLTLNSLKVDVNKFIHFGFETLNEEIEKTKEGELFMIDEQEETSRFGVGAMRELGEIRDTERIVRAKNISFLWISPDRVFTHNPHYIIQAWKIDSERELNMSIIKDSNDIPRGYIITPRLKNKVLLNDYKSLKHNFIDKFLNRDYKDIQKKLEEQYQQLLKIPNFTKFNLAEKRLKARMEFSNFTGTEIEEIIAYVTMRIKEDGLDGKKK